MAVAGGAPARASFVLGPRHAVSVAVQEKNNVDLAAAMNRRLEMVDGELLEADA